MWSILQKKKSGRLLGPIWVSSSILNGNNNETGSQILSDCLSLDDGNTGDFFFNFKSTFLLF